jgi:hypothetical protein
MAGLLRLKIQDDFRPIVSVDTYGGQIDCLIDTGANINVFTLGVENIKDYFPDAEALYRYKVELTGFGNGITDAVLYKIKRIKIKSDFDDDYINLENVYMACCSKTGIGAGIVLSCGVFDEVILSLKRKFNEIDIEHDLTTYTGNIRLDKERRKVVRTSACTQDMLSDNI